MDATRAGGSPVAPQGGGQIGQAGGPAGSAETLAGSIESRVQNAASGLEEIAKNQHVDIEDLHVGHVLKEVATDAVKAIANLAKSIFKAISGKKDQPEAEKGSRSDAPEYDLGGLANRFGSDITAASIQRSVQKEATKAERPSSDAPKPGGEAKKVRSQSLPAQLRSKVVRSLTGAKDTITDTANEAKEAVKTLAKDLRGKQKEEGVQEEGSEDDVHKLAEEPVGERQNAVIGSDHGNVLNDRLALLSNDKLYLPPNNKAKHDSLNREFIALSNNVADGKANVSELKSKYEEMKGLYKDKSTATQFSDKGATELDTLVKNLKPSSEDKFLKDLLNGLEEDLKSN